MELNSEADVSERRVRDHSPSAVLGTVAKVIEHTEADDSSNHEVNVVLRDGGKEPRRVPVAVSHKGEAIVPEKGDFVMVSYLGGQGSTPVVTDVIQTDRARDRAPLARQGHWRHQFGADGDLFVEAEPADHSSGDAEIVRIAKKPDGLSEPTAQIALDDSTSPPTITIEGTGEINIKTSGTVTVEGDVTLGGPNGEPVARQGDTVEVDPDSGTGEITSGSDNVDAT